MVNKFILGIANFGNEYLGKKLDWIKCFEILDEFEKLGGELVDTANDYGNSVEIINKFIQDKNSKLKIIYKHDGTLNEYKTGLKCENLNTNNLFAFMMRTKRICTGEDKNILFGQSIYYPEELNPDSKVIEIPNCSIWDAYLPIMHLHAKIFVRSNYRINPEFQIKRKELIDGYIIGVENVEEVRKNMEKFNGHY